MTKKKESLFEKLSPKPEKIIDIPGLGPVTIQAPNFDKVVQLAQENEAIGEKGMKFALALMAVKELSTEEIVKLATENDGFVVAALINAVNEALNLGDTGLGKPAKG